MGAAVTVSTRSPRLHPTGCRLLTRISHLQFELKRPSLDVFLQEMEPAAGGKEKKLGGGEKSDGGERKKEVVVNSSPGETRASRLQTQHPVAPIHVAPHGAATSATASAGYQPAPTPPQVMLA